jgi:uncharacterized protein (DUF302 family)
MELDYTVETAKPFDEAVQAVADAAAANGFRVQYVHDVTATLAEKGFEREPMAIVEMCNARYAHDVLARDPKIALMLPCPVLVYEESSKVFISTMRPSLIADFFPDAALEDVAGEVEDFMVRIVDLAAE